MCDNIQFLIINTARECLGTCQNAQQRMIDNRRTQGKYHQKYPKQKLANVVENDKEKAIAVGLTPKTFQFVYPPKSSPFFATGHSQSARLYNVKQLPLLKEGIKVSIDQNISNN